MGVRRHAIICAWSALAVLVIIIGCGGSGAAAGTSNPNSGSVALASFVGSWNGTMLGSDGSNTQIYLDISDTGAITWTTYTPGVPNGTFQVTETGAIQNGGNFTVTGSIPATANVTITGTLRQSGMPGAASGTGCCGTDFLNGSGTMTNDSAQVKVTLQLSGFGL